MAEHITYGEGGFDQKNPDNNVVSIVEVLDPEPPDLSTDDRIATLEATNATLIADLSKATTLAQVRAAAVNAKERTRLPVSESPSVRDSPRE